MKSQNVYNLACESCVLFGSLIHNSAFFHKRGPVSIKKFIAVATLKSVSRSGDIQSQTGHCPG